MTAREAVECGELAAHLRELRERTGLSLAALAARTPYSKSSWERYLNGKQPVPRQAVQALCALAGEPVERLLALWELADAAWSGRSAPATAVVAKDVPVPPRRTWRTAPRLGPAVFLVCAGAVVAGAVTTALVARGDEGSARPLASADSAPSAESSPPRLPGCSGPACEGQDPVRMACGGAGMVTPAGARTATGGQRLQIRYAQSCGAVWVRATGLRTGDRVELTVPGRPVQRVVAGPRDSAAYRSTPMAAAEDPASARACLHAASGSPPECLTGAPQQ